MAEVRRYESELIDVAYPFCKGGSRFIGVERELGNVVEAEGVVDAGVTEFEKDAAFGVEETGETTDLKRVNKGVPEKCDIRRCESGILCWRRLGGKAVWEIVFVCEDDGRLEVSQRLDLVQQPDPQKSSFVLVIYRPQARRASG